MTTITLTATIADPPPSPLDIECPYCKTSPGQRCVVRTGTDEFQVRSDSHQRRVDRWAGMITMHEAIVASVDWPSARPVVPVT